MCVRVCVCVCACVRAGLPVVLAAEEESVLLGAAILAASAAQQDEVCILHNLTTIHYNYTYTLKYFTRYITSTLKSAVMANSVIHIWKGQYYIHS